jgi:hypothetical protein
MNDRIFVIWCPVRRESRYFERKADLDYALSMTCGRCPGCLWDADPSHRAEIRTYVLAHKIVPEESNV